MKNETKSRIGRLSTRLITYVIFLNFVIIVLLVIIQIIYRYKNEIKTIDNQIKYIEKSYLPSIASGLYKIDNEQLSLLINGILKLNHFEFVEIIETTGQNNFQIAGGERISKKGVEKKLDIIYTRPDGILIHLGELTVYAGYQSIYQKLKSEMFVLLGSSALLIFALSILMLVVFQYLVSRHLINLAGYAERSNIDNLRHDLVLKRKSRRHPDELDHVVKAINSLEIRLKQGIEEIEATSSALVTSEAQLKLIYNNVSDMIVLMRVENNELIIETMNSVFVSTLKKAGFTIDPRDVINKSHNILASDMFNIPKDITDNYFQKLYYCLTTGNILRFESHYKLPLMSIYLINLITPIFDQSGNCSHLLFVARNITEQKIAEKEILNAVIKTEEKEKSRFAKEIHDGLGPILSTTKLYVQSLIDENDENERKKTLERVFGSLEEAIAGIKEISNNLSPHILRNFGLIKAIQTFINKITQNEDIKIELKSNLKNRLEEIIETTFYRVIVELINNTFKHADASKVTIEIMQDKNRLDFVYTDNGKGFDVKKVMEEHKGFGLFNMQNRFSTLNGQIIIKSDIHKGIKVDGYLPLADLSELSS